MIKYKGRIYIYVKNIENGKKNKYDERSREYSSKKIIID